MGLAPYGKPKYVNEIKDNLLDLKEDGSFRLNMIYFDFASGLQMTNKKFHNLFNGNPRQPEDQITQKEMDIAKSIQVVLEEIVLKIIKNISIEFNYDNLCLAGGVALNCVLNGKIIKQNSFKNVWIQPAAGDAGGSLGAALLAWHEYLDKERVIEKSDKMKNAFLGKQFCNEEISHILDDVGAYFEKLSYEEIYKKIAYEMKNGKVVGWFQGKMEFGPRALGNRSIIGSPLIKDMQKRMNLQIKNRESFRPFAPVIKLDKLSEWFDLKIESPYMMIVTDVIKEKRISTHQMSEKTYGLNRVAEIRSKIPAVTHIDYSARIQTVTMEQNSKLYMLISQFEEITECPIIINTSFNIRGEPIVSSPLQAYECFMKTGIDFLVIENFIIDKRKQDKTKVIFYQNQYDDINLD